MTRRLVLTFLGLTVVVVLVLVIPLGVATARNERDALTLDLERDARVIAAFAEDTLEGIAEEDLLGAAQDYDSRTGARAVIVDDRGDLLADSQPLRDAPEARNFAGRPEIAAALDGEVSTGSRFSESLDSSIFFVAVPVSSGGEVHGAVRLTYPTGEVDDRVQRAWLTLSAVALVSLAVAGGLGFVLARSVTRPLRRLQQTASTLGGGDLSARADLDDGPQEVRSLGRDFNEMAERIEDLVTTQESFVADASHQLRTPLTALKLRLENLEPAVTDAEATADLDAAEAEVSRLSRLVSGLLALARADREATGASREAVRVADLIGERSEMWTPVAADRGVTLEAAADERLVALATPDRLSQVLDNLLANALEAAPAGSVVSLRAERLDGAVGIHVVDGGAGLSAAERAAAFDRFWQGPRGTGSSGLGLAIVEKLVRADGGTVHLRDAAGGGLDAVVTLDTPPTPPGGHGAPPA